MIGDDLHENIEATLMMLHSKYKNRVKIIRSYGNLPHIKCFPGKLNQVFMTLLKNASQAIADQGEIGIETAAAGEEVLIKICDTGMGIPPEELGRLFDVGFSAGESRVKSSNINIASLESALCSLISYLCS